MKKFYLFAATALALSSCTSDEFFGNSSPASGNGEISFGTFTKKATRAESTGAEAAAKLNKNFIVYGFKYYTSEPTSATDVADATKQQKVFDRYNVNYVEGTANTTESNTANWEYVGYKSVADVEQTIKYWDYSADAYVFSAVSGTGITAEKIESVAKSTTATTDEFASGTLTYNKDVTPDPDKYDKGWVVTIPQGGSLSDLYASERVPVTKAGYQQTVNLKFYNMGAKVRFAMYEIIPGYEVHIDNIYYGDNSNKATNFGVNGNFTTLSTTGDSKLIVTYYNSGTLENHPKVTPLGSAVNTAEYGEFGTNIQATEAIGTASNAATYDQAGGLYTDIIPMTGNGLSLKIDYTLTAPDTGEKIHVTGATAKVPANFTDWKANFAYTYLFKISDNTNGSTGNDDSDQPVAGLYPITFDACVVANEDGIQETITSVSNPSITTYQNGEIVTKNNEYVAGDIYFEEGNLSDLSTYRVYEVNNYTGNSFETQGDMTEEVVANYLNNFCVLTGVTVTLSNDDDFIPLSDGTFLHKAANVAGKFNAKSGKTYVITNKPAGTATQWKVVKVAGSSADVTYTQTIAADSKITATTGATSEILYQLKSNSPKANSVVHGAAPLITIWSGTTDVTTKFTVTPGSSAGNYKIALTPEAIATSDVDGTYTVKFNGDGDQTFVVDLDYTLSAASVNIEAGNTTGASTTLTVGAASYSGAVIASDPEDNKGITITDNGDGTYTVKADATVKNGAYTATIASKTLTINVDNYQFDAKSYVYNMNTDGNLIETANKVTLQTNGTTPATATGIVASAITIKLGGSSSDAITLDGSAGVYTVGLKTAGAGNGTYTLTKDNTAAKATVTINKYAIDGGTIARSTGRVELGVTVNGKAVNASASKVKITKDADSSDQTANFTITANGQKVVISGAKSTLEAGAYTVEYYLETGKTNKVATSTLTVN